MDGDQLSGAEGSPAWHPALRPNTDEDEEHHPELSQMQDEPVSKAVEAAPAPEAKEVDGSKDKIPDSLEESFVNVPKPTNSFPPVPPHESAAAPPEEPLPQSQAEEIVKEVEEEAPEALAQSAETDPWGSTGDSAEADFFSQSIQPQPETAQPTSDADARYEEGIPLVQHEEKPAEPAAEATTTSDPFAGEGGDDDFFSQISSKPADADPKEGLERKSTSQVLDSIGIQDKEKPQDSAGEPKEQDLAALWAAELDDDDLLDDESNNAAVDTSVFFEDDGEGFLDDTPADAAVAAAPAVAAAEPAKAQQSQSRYQPKSYAPSALPNPTPKGQNPYAAAAPPFGQQSYGYQPAAVVPPAVPPKTGPKAQSFADKSKGGYSSPYDLPMDLSRPKRRAAAPAPAVTSPVTRDSTAMPPPPPQRTSSMNAGEQNRNIYSATAPPPGAGPPPGARPPSGAGPPPTAPPGPRKGSTSGSSSFFEELPVAPKVRPPSVNRYAPQQNQAPPQAPPQGLPQGPPQGFQGPPQGFQGPPQGFQGPPQGYQAQPKAPQAPPQPAQYQAPQAQGPPQGQQYQARQGPPQGPPQVSPQGPPQAPPQASPTSPNTVQNNFGLVGPSKAPLSFDSPPQQAPQQGAPPRASSSNANRYSPSQANQQQPQKRSYSTSGAPPASRSSSMSQQHPFQPRTSSPLTYSTTAGDEQAAKAAAMAPPAPPSRSPENRYTPAHAQNQAPRAAPQYGGQPAPASPERTMAGPPLQQAPTYGAVDWSTPQAPPGQPNWQKTFTSKPPENENYVEPTDGTQHDPLKRWQGAPIFKFGFGGTIVVSLPQRVPRYLPGQVMPVIKCSPGEVKLHPAKFLPLDEHISSFPGPLKAKGKKKEVVEWLQKGVEKFESQHVQAPAPHETPFDIRKRNDEKVLLWKVMKILVENDGMVDGNPTVDKAVRDILSPELGFEGPANQASYTTNMMPTGITPTGTPPAQQGASADALEKLRQHLLRGEREQAVWHAVDQKLWGHAMLISSTLPRDVWKQVAQEFVKNDVKLTGENTESLAALYSVFAGAWEETVDELVPPSARAGLQMVSKNPAGGPAKNAFDGLDRWRETMSLILSNRSIEDTRSMISLGHLLSSYGRTEAAHICYLFSKMPGLFGGSDDPQSTIVLLGGNHRIMPFDYAKDIYSVLLTEVFEYATSTLPSSPAMPLPHLQAFKLWHAEILAEHGFRDRAQQYCDTLAAALKAGIRASPYFHGNLYISVDDLGSRLRQAPKDGSNSWISRPSMDKVSGSVWNKFTQFVAGEESDEASVASQKAEVEGPFAKMSGDTPPTVSRSNSPEHGPLQPAGPYVPAAALGAPPPGAVVNARYTPRSSFDHGPTLRNQTSQSSLQGHTVSPRMGTSPAATDRSQHDSRPGSSYGPGPSKLSMTASGQEPRKWSTSSTSDRPRLTAYQPMGTGDRHHPGYEPRSSAYAQRSSSYGPRSYQPSPARSKSPASNNGSDHYEPKAPKEAPAPIDQTPKKTDLPSIAQEPPTPHAAPPSLKVNQADNSEDSKPEERPAFGGYEPLSAVSDSHSDASSFQPPTSGYDPHGTSGYEPPSSDGGYQPPSYEPAVSDTPETNGESGSDQAEDKPRKKKGIMDLSDDEDELLSRANTIKKKQRSDNDKAADEAFRRAVEADAKKSRTESNASRTSWFGSFFSGPKKEDLDAGKKPIKAQLGEESSFYFDKNLGKWVNKKAGADDAQPSKPTPPPPKGGPPMRTASSSSLASMGSAPPPPGGPPRGMAPPPRPGSSAGPPRPGSSSGPPRPGSSSGPPPPSALTSAGAGPPSQHSSRQVSPNLPPTSAAPGAGGSGSGENSNAGGDEQPPSALPPGMAPPSRPGTGMSGVSTASSIDDLIGAPAARKGAKKGKKARGYVDVMAK